jgi:hypothetical protein
MKSASVFIASIVGFAGMAFAAKPPPSYNSESVQSISATVESIDLAKRLVVLKGPKGRTETVEVSQAVRNLAQVKVGDSVVVKYYASIAAVIVPKGAATDLTNSSGVTRAAEGAKPGVAVGNIVVATVVIQAVDKESHTVVFSGSDGLVRNVEVTDPDAQKFVATLKKGDQVEVTFGEALAVSVEEAK